MKRQLRIFGQGLAITIPVIFTIYMLYATVTWIDGKMRLVMGDFLPPDIPGLGFAAGMIIIYLAGLLMSLWLFSRIVQFGERLIERMPFVKTLYGSVRDLLKFFSGEGDKPEGEAVQLELGEDSRMLGIVTSRADGGKSIGVYLPMSYQLGGFLVYVPRERVKPAGMDVESALKLILTAGVGRKPFAGTAGDRAAKPPGPSSTGASTDRDTEPRRHVL